MGVETKGLEEQDKQSPWKNGRNYGRKDGRKEGRKEEV